MTKQGFQDRRSSSREGKLRRAKVAVTLPDALLTQARDRIRAHEAPSLSALVTQALQEKLERDSLQTVLEQMATEHGPLTPEELAWADQVLEG